MNNEVYLISMYVCTFLLIATKALDLYTTIKYVPAHAERNLLVQLLMKKLRFTFNQSLAFVMMLFFLTTYVCFLAARETGVIGIIINNIMMLIISYFQIGAYYLNKERKRIPGMNWILSWQFYNP